MMLFGLLLVPLAIGLFGLLRSQGQVTLKEFFAQEAAMLVLIGAGYFIALSNRSADTEIWNGVITAKTKDSTQCCHSYSCDCREVCSGSGKDRSCHTECDTCYRHGSRSTGWGGDVEWDAHSSNGEHVYHDGCNSPGSSPPSRWEQIVIGEPTAVEHGFTNYIKGNPDTILRRTGALERFASAIPAYPEVYDHYRANRFLAVGVNLPDAGGLNAKLSEVNARLGSPKEVNVTIVVARQADRMYKEALNEAWLGGKKNDLIVVIGAPNFPEIAWADVVSWTRNETVKINLRDRLGALKTFDGDKVLGIVSQEVSRNFVRRNWDDFEYLASTIEPPEWALWTLFILGCLISVGLTIYFWRNDPFNEGFAGRRSFHRRW